MFRFERPKHLKVKQSSHRLTAFAAGLVCCCFVACVDPQLLGKLLMPAVWRIMGVKWVMRLLEFVWEADSLIIRCLESWSSCRMCRMFQMSSSVSKPPYWASQSLLFQDFRCFHAVWAVTFVYWKLYCEKMKHESILSHGCMLQVQHCVCTGTKMIHSVFIWRTWGVFKKFSTFSGHD